MSELFKKGVYPEFTLSELLGGEVGDETNMSAMLQSGDDSQSGQTFYSPTIINSNLDEYLTFTFYEPNIATGTGAGHPETIVVDRNCTIIEVAAHVETAPGAGNTLTIDINKGGTTIFTTQANRPSITGTNTTNTSPEPDVTSLSKGDELTMDIDTNDGSPVTLTVYVRCSNDL